MAKLQDLAIVQNGQIMSRLCDKDATEGKTIKVITPKSINNGIINHDDLGTNTLRPGADESKLMIAQEGDIIIKLSTPYDSAIVREMDKNLVIPSFCALIRCLEKTDKNYILAIMNNQNTINTLVNDISGAGMRVIKIGSIRQLNIPDLPAEQQFAIGELYIETLKEAELLRKLAINQMELINGIINEKIMEDK